MGAIFVVDADRAHRESVAQALNALGFQVEGLDSCERALHLLKGQMPRMILVSDGGAGQALKELLLSAGGTPVVVMGQHPASEHLLDALSMGACDYLVKPVGREALRCLLDEVNCGDSLSVCCECNGRDTGSDRAIIAGACAGMMTALKMAGTVAKTGATVLLRGESGTGKELFAREIHRVSGRSGAFVALNCAAVAEGVAESELFGHEKGAFTGAVVRRAGCFEQAHGGTLFLDEIGDAPLAFQAKLLRALDSGEFFRVGGQAPVCFDARVVAATNRNLDDLVVRGDFRQDLFYRLSAVTISLPPLRERREDIPEIVRTTLTRLTARLGCRVRGVSREALALLMACDWPGNMRELQHAIYRAVLVCRGDVILPVHLEGLAQAKGVEGADGVPTLAAVEAAHIKKILDIAGGNRGYACRLLGISRPTLRRKLRHYNLISVSEDDAIPA